ncbi:GyrB-like ATPase domain protein [Nile crocodilepox virus]|uniref:GyrB-like ATPase domain protein n=1 Tax=Nile crocodilepox virus (isolate Crocodylus niloticus/Zimbabwe/Ume/2001) TaxID=1289473 RepID=Q070G6_CPRVZ|nr:GyrB-like ATPase domain protein [Nile crocodilepox virus]ABJ08976.1 GyrB-like ATPase domain protein [Nile crocodilepox virus]
MRYSRIDNDVYLPASAAACLGPCERVRRRTIFGEVIEYHAGAARLVDEALVNAVAHCVLHRNGSVYVELEDGRLTVANTSDVPVHGFVDGARCVVPRSLLTTLYVSGVKSKVRPLASQYGVGLKMIRELAGELKLTVSDGRSSYEYKSVREDGVDASEERVDAYPRVDDRLGSRFFQLSFTVSALNLDAQSDDEACLGLEEFLVTRLDELAFYLYRTSNCVDLFFRGSLVGGRDPVFVHGPCLIKHFLFSYSSANNDDVMGCGVAYLFRRDVFSPSSSALVNGAAVDRMWLTYSIARRAAQAHRYVERDDVGVFLVIDCRYIAFSDPGKRAAIGIFGVPRDMFQAADVAFMSRKPIYRPEGVGAASPADTTDSSDTDDSDASDSDSEDSASGESRLVGSLAANRHRAAEPSSLPKGDAEQASGPRPSRPRHLDNVVREAVALAKLRFRSPTWTSCCKLAALVAAYCLVSRATTVFISSGRE